MTPLQQEPSAHAPWMRTIFGRAFISGSLRGRFRMTKQIRLCLPARWGGIRSATALRISHYDKQGHVVGRLPISEKKNHWPFGKSNSLSERPVVAHSGEIAAGIRNLQSGYGYPGCGLARQDGHWTRP